MKWTSEVTQFHRDISQMRKLRNCMSFPEVSSQLLEEVGLDLGFLSARLSAFIVNVPFDQK